MNIRINPTHWLGRLLQVIEQRLWVCSVNYNLFLATTPITTVSIQAITTAKAQLSGAVINRERMRERIISPTDIEPQEFYIPPIASQAEFGNKGTAFERLPEMLQQWCRSGRRAYSPTPDLQKFLEIASVGEMHWKDILFPFPSFAIKLPIPIMLREGPKGELIDTVLVSTKDNMLSIMAIGADTERSKVFAPSFTNEVDRLVKQRKWNKVRRAMNTIKTKDLYSPSVICFWMPLEWESPINDIAHEDIAVIPCGQIQAGEVAANMMTDKTAPLIKDKGTIPDDALLLVRIVVGLCLHLDMLRTRPDPNMTPTWTPSGSKVVEWVSVGDSTELCELHTSHELSPLEKEAHIVIRRVGLSEALKVLAIHGRSAHWRRPPRKGSDPTCPKSVYVRWTLVGAKNLDTGTMPVGTESKVSVQTLRQYLMTPSKLSRLL